jgi:hypothetical protein
MPAFESFTKALRAYFEMDGTTTIKEYKELTEQDKVEISTMLNGIGYEHPQYVAK